MKLVLWVVFVLISALNAQARGLDSNELDIASAIIAVNLPNLPPANKKVTPTRGEVSYSERHEGNFSFVDATYTFFGAGRPIVISTETYGSTLPRVTDRAMTERELRLGYALLCGREGATDLFDFSGSVLSGSVTRSVQGRADVQSYDLPLTSQGCSTLGGCQTYHAGVLHLVVRTLPGEDGLDVSMQYQREN